MASTIRHLTDLAALQRSNRVAGMAARGLILGAAATARLKVGFLLVRKPGKLPVAAMGVDYAAQTHRSIRRCS